MLSTARSPALSVSVVSRRAARSGAGWARLPPAVAIAFSACSRSTRAFSRSSLALDETKPSSPQKSGFDFPDLPSISSLTAKANAELTLKLSSLSTTLQDLRDSLNAIQTEVSRGPYSTYSRVMASREDLDVHPEMAWDATVRVGTELGDDELAFLRARKVKMRTAFAKLMGVDEGEIDLRDLPIISIAGSGGGYRAMVNTLGSCAGAKEAGVLDVVAYISGVSGSCWALNLLYSIGGADLEKTIQHVKSRITTPFLDPSAVDVLTAKETRECLLSGLLLKESSPSGEISIVDVYGTLVSSRLSLPATDLTKLSLADLKVSSQQKHILDGSNPLPIYCTIRHEVPRLKELEQGQKKNKENETASERKKRAEDRWLWFEMSPMEFGCDELGAWIPTWSLGRLFEGGKNVTREPELSLTILNGIFSSAFCATLFSYYKEIKPLVRTLPFFTSLDSWILSNYQTSLDAIHPITPAEVPSFLYHLPSLDPSSPIAQLKTLGLMDAGANLNLPYVPLFRRDVDLIISFDASADSRELWFERADAYAKKRELKTWPRVREFLEVIEGNGGEEGAEGASETAAKRVDEAKRQEGEVPRTGKRERDETNPEAPPVGSAPSSKQSRGGLGREPPLQRCNIWLGSTREGDSDCRNDAPTVEDVVARDGINLAYFPLSPDASKEWSTWKFDYTEDQTEKLVQLAKANFKSGEDQIKTVIRGIWMRKRKQRLEEEAPGKEGAEAGSR